MALGDIVPWKWGGLRPSGRELRPFEGFRREMEVLHREMDRLFEDLVGESMGSSLLPESWTRGELMPKLDVSEDGKGVQVTVDLPGLDEKDVEVTLSDHTLTIRGEKREEKEKKEKDYFRRERAYGHFRRSIEIPADIDADAIEASFKKGVLTVRLPKTKAAQEKVRQIEVKAA